MTATLTLFRPSILDPIEADGRTQTREPGFAHDRPRRSAPGDGEQPQLREPGSATFRAPTARDGRQLELREAPAVAPPAAPVPAPAPAAAPERDGTSHQPMVQHDGGPTLDDLIVGVWEGLAAHATVACPACNAAMTPRYSAGPAPVGGRCRSCGTTIA
jgi:hypothetical protein